MKNLPVLQPHRKQIGAFVGKESILSQGKDSATDHAKKKKKKKKKKKNGMNTPSRGLYDLYL